MNLNPYVAEKLMEYRQAEMNAASRIAWTWTDINKKDLHVVGKRSFKQISK